MEEHATELFAIYGAQVLVPKDWRVELNPKGTRERGDVAFQDREGNRFFVSWGPLKEARNKFSDLEEHRDKSIERVRKGQDVKSLEVIEKRDARVFDHTGSYSHVSAIVRQGVTGRSVSRREILSVHFYCEESRRYYVVFGEERSDNEQGNFVSLFESFYRSVKCH